MGLKEDITPYLDPSCGLVRASDGGDDNMPLFTAQLIELLSDDDPNKIMFRSRLSDFLNKCEITTGLYVRKPDGDDNSVDNLIGVLSSGVAQAYAIYFYGSKNFYSYDCSKPFRFTLRFWFARFVGFVPFVKMTNEKSINVFSQLLYWIACSSNVFSSGTSNVILQWLMNRHCYGKHFVVDRSIELWRALMLKQYPNGMSEVFALYHGENHPFAKYARKDFL